jgi:hypothetical protein
MGSIEALQIDISCMEVLTQFIKIIFNDGPTFLNGVYIKDQVLEIFLNAGLPQLHQFPCRSQYSSKIPKSTRTDFTFAIFAFKLEIWDCQAFKTLLRFLNFAI